MSDRAARIEYDLTARISHGFANDIIVENHVHCPIVNTATNCDEVPRFVGALIRRHTGGERRLVGQHVKLRDALRQYAVDFIGQHGFHFVLADLRGADIERTGNCQR